MDASQDTGAGGFGPTRQFAAFIAGIRLEDVPSDVRDRVKYLMLDALACGLAGARLPWSMRAVAALKELEGGGSATLWGWGKSVTASTAALLNGSFVQGFELDDFYEGAPHHPGSVVVPSLFGTAEALGITSGEQVLLAAALGYESGPRFGLAVDAFQMIARGFHCGSIIGALASAVASAKLRQLSAPDVEEALGSAATQACGLLGTQFEAMVKRMNHGFAARAGVVSAALAAHGYTGIKNVIERSYGGFISCYGDPKSSDAGRLVAQLGEKFYALDIGVKAYAAMGQTHPAIDAALQLRGELGMRADQVEKVTIELPLVPALHGGWKLERPATEIGAQMNCAYAFAVTLVDGAASLPQYTLERINQDDVWSLMAKVAVQHSQEMDDLYEHYQSRRVTRVKVWMKDGSRHELLVPEARGYGTKRFANADIAAKFRVLAGHVMPQQRVAALERAVLDIESEFPRVLEILAQPVSSPV